MLRIEHLMKDNNIIEITKFLSYFILVNDDMKFFFCY